MNEDIAADLWNLFKEYLDKKHIEMAAERYIDLLADIGMSEIQLQALFGNSKTLDAAIQYYLEMDQEDAADDYNDEWDD
jgi:hypothetical protein